MTAPSSLDPADFLHEHLAQSSPDLMRQMLTTFINTLLSADADAVCGAAWGQVSLHSVRCLPTQVRELSGKESVPHSGPTASRAR